MAWPHPELYKILGGIFGLAAPVQRQVFVFLQCCVGMCAALVAVASRHDDFQPAFPQLDELIHRGFDQRSAVMRPGQRAPAQVDGKLGIWRAARHDVGNRIHHGNIQ